MYKLSRKYRYAAIWLDTCPLSRNNPTTRSPNQMIAAPDPGPKKIGLIFDVVAELIGLLEDIDQIVLDRDRFFVIGQLGQRIIDLLYGPGEF